MRDPVSLDALAGLPEDLLIAWEIEFPRCSAVKQLPEAVIGKGLDHPGCLHHVGSCHRNDTLD